MNQILLQSTIRDLSPAQLDAARDLKEKGLIESIERREYVNCVDSNDDDYFEAKERGCDATVELPENPEPYITCTGCGRDIEIQQKRIHSQWSAYRSDNGVYKFVRDELRHLLNGQASKINNGVKYLDKRLEPTLNVRHSGYRTRVILAFEYLEREVLDAVRIFNHPTVFVLVGNAVPQASQYDSRGISFITVGELLRPEEETDIESVFRKSQDQSVLSHQLAETGINLFQTERDRYSWREFEHTVQHCLATCFETSRLLGGEESGEQVPEGVLALEHGAQSDVFIWDAKYVRQKGDSRSLSGEYEDMSKHLVNFLSESNVRDIYGNLSGFLVISPSVSGSSITRLAERIQRRLSEGELEWNGAITLVTFDALCQLFNYFIEDYAEVKSKPREFRKHIARLFTRSNYHPEEPEEYSESDLPVYHVSDSDVRRVFNEYIQPQSIETKGVNIEGYLANIRSLDY